MCVCARIHTHILTHTQDLRKLRVGTAVGKRRSETEEELGK